VSKFAAPRGEVRWAMHGAVLALVGGAVMAASPESALVVSRMLGVGLLCIAALLAALQVAARRELDRRALARGAVTVMGFAGAGLLSYLAVGWLVVAILVTIAVAVAGWGSLQRPRPQREPGGATTGR
jgi:uncharacterized membrane protein